jgi:coenzyme PQQ biosynthesis protein PqqD
VTTEPDVLREGRLRRVDGILAQEAHGQTVLLRLEDGGYYALDEVGAAIWELCDGQRSVDEIVALLCEDFDAPEEVVRTDVLEFVDDLRRERLLVLDAG